MAFTRPESERMTEDILAIVRSGGSEGVRFCDLMDAVPGFRAQPTMDSQIQLPTLVACPHEAVECKEDGSAYSRNRLIAWVGHSFSAQFALIDIIRSQGVGYWIVPPNDYPKDKRPKGPDGELPAFQGNNFLVESDHWVPLRLYVTKGIR